MKNKIVGFLTILCVLISTAATLPATASAAAGGKCGDNLTWTLDESGVLTISGSGEMWDFTFDAYSGSVSSPWHEYMKNITEIRFEEGITKIGDYAFRSSYYDSNIERLVIPDSVRHIGESAFESNVTLKYIIIGDGVETIEAWAFFGVPAEVVYIGKNVRYIGESAFNSNNIFYAEAPPSTITDLFYGGSFEQWNQIVIGDKNYLIAVSASNPGAKNRVYYNFDGRYKTSVPEGCSLKIGDYIEFGKFGGKPILWQVLNINENSAMLFAAEPVMKQKPFDAKGESEIYHSKGNRKERGSNNWADSTVRQWLNSEEETVLWTHCPPVETFKTSLDGVNIISNGYDKEAGFLSDNNFTEYERNCILKTNNYFVDTEDGDYTTEDKVFLLSPFEVNFLANQSKDLRLPEGMTSSNLDLYWLRENLRPKYSDLAAWAKGIHTDAESNVGTATYTEAKGFLAASSSADIRPAMMLDLSAVSFNHGNGSASDPYSYTKVTLNGAAISFDQPPVILNDRTLVPVRAIFEALGATVDWNSETQTVTSQKGDIVISMTVGGNIMYRNGQEISLDVAPQIVNSRTLVPARAIAESFNCTVDWDEETHTVIITG